MTTSDIIRSTSIAMRSVSPPSPPLRSPKVAAPSALMTKLTRRKGSARSLLRYSSMSRSRFASSLEGRRSTNELLTHVVLQKCWVPPPHNRLDHACRIDGFWHIVDPHNSCSPCHAEYGAREGSCEPIRPVSVERLSNEIFVR